MQIQRPFSQLDWLSTPEAVRQYIIQLENAILQLQQQLDQLEKRTEKLETQTKKNSQNSGKPPSSDSPYKKINKKTKSSNRKKGAQKGHKGNRQAMMKPTDTIAVPPAICSCGNTQFDPQTMKPFYTHQYIELPEIKMDVLHFCVAKVPMCMLR